MRGLILAIAVLALIAQPVLTRASRPGTQPTLDPPPAHTRAETLWIFDADFEDLVGDNAGWTTYDRTGTLAVPNYWHKDTIRINGFAHLGDSTWWCGKYDPCWRQPRGYGNDWYQILERHFDEASGLTPGTTLTFEYDQRIAMEKDYDYGYVDISLDDGSSWTTLSTVTNPGFVGTPGLSQDWDSVHPVAGGHQALDLSDYSGSEFSLRFRFESDGAYSSQDQYDDPGHPVLDGAWQLDNFVLWADTEPPQYLFIDDCESPGDNGWTHDDVPASGQVGVVFERRFESFAGRSGWMMAAYDTTAGSMVDGQDCELRSPPINVSGAPALVGRWEGWFDLTSSGDDLVSLWLSTSDIAECLDWHGGMEPAWWPTYGGPFWIQMEQGWNAYAGQDWLGLNFLLWNHEPSASHGVGFVLDRIRVGVPLETGIPDVDTSRVTLGSPHPNPFEQNTTLSYSIATQAHVSARVVDVAGRVVRTLIDRTVDPGEHVLSWDGRNDSGARAASGVYFVLLESLDGSKTEEAKQKLILLD